MICEHHRNLQRLNDRRADIVSGRVVPNDEDLFSNDEGEENASDDFVDNGIPNFWLEVIRN